jgi:hypothetical protein
MLAWIDLYFDIYGSGNPYRTADLNQVSMGRINEG